MPYWTVSFDITVQLETLGLTESEIEIFESGGFRTLPESLQLWLIELDQVIPHGWHSVRINGYNGEADFLETESTTIRF